MGGAIAKEARDRGHCVLDPSTCVGVERVIGFASRAVKSHGKRYAVGGGGRVWALFSKDPSGCTRGEWKLGAVPEAGRLVRGWCCVLGKRVVA